MVAANLVTKILAMALATQGTCVDACTTPPPQPSQAMMTQRMQSLANEAHLFSLAVLPAFELVPSVVIESKIFGNAKHEGGFSCQEYKIFLPENFDADPRKGDVIIAHELSHAQDCLTGTIHDGKTECRATHTGWEIAAARGLLESATVQLQYAKDNGCF